jgi:hypothetical protein
MGRSHQPNGALLADFIAVTLALCWMIIEGYEKKLQVLFFLITENIRFSSEPVDFHDPASSFRLTTI